MNLNENASDREGIARGIVRGSPCSATLGVLMVHNGKHAEQTCRFPNPIYYGWTQIILLVADLLRSRKDQSLAKVARAEVGDVLLNPHSRVKTILWHVAYFYFMNYLPSDYSTSVAGCTLSAVREVQMPCPGSSPLLLHLKLDCEQVLIAFCRVRRLQRCPTSSSIRML